ncbi:DUF5018 domain-containing protein [Maribacter sp. 2307UL18-2]|uniref:DUF5018 domain-containing protein n=1 Tax=Maribacter sp. 2307UL18-2 TaxID=3386274 RepID=UPI0039BC63C9
MKKIHFTLFFVLISLFSCTDEEGTETELSGGNTITSFTVSSGNLEYAVTIDGKTIDIITPYNVTTANNLVMEVLISQGATIDPNPKDITLITDPIEFTVTAENGAESVYTLTLSREESPENAITGIRLKNNKNSVDEVNADIDQVSGEATKELPKNWSLTEVTAEIEISAFASIAPDPSTISDYSLPVDFVVTAENGTTKNYRVILSKILSQENDFSAFILLFDTLNLPADIDREKGMISQRVPQDTDLTQLSVAYEIPEYATIMPDPSGIMDYSQPVTFVITSENNEEKTYTVGFEFMEETINYNCDLQNASKWFGGDDRGNKISPEFFHAPRNVGTGQSLTPEQDMFITSYSIRFSNYFRFVDDEGNVNTYFGDSTVRLQLRDGEGNVLAYKDKTFNNPMQLFWQTFDLTDLNLILKKDTLYHFTWYLVDGETLGIHTGTHGNTELHSGLCDEQGLSGTSTIREETHLDDWDTWGYHPWHFNFRLTGFQ